MNQSGPRRHYFISYSHKDQDMADQIKDDLEEQGFEIWLDNSDTEPGTEWDDAIEENIKESIAVLYLVSPNSRSSPYIRHEIAYAKTYKRNIIPLWIKGDTDWARVVAFGLFTTQQIDLREGEYKAGIEKLIQTLKKLTGPEARFMRYIEESNDNSSMQKVEDRENQLPADQISDREREMSEDSKKIGQPPPVNKQSLLRFVLTVCKNLLYIPSKANTQKNISYTSTTSSSRVDPPNPYKGLHAFGYEDKWSFFGRENLIRKMVEQVRDILRDERQDSQVPRCMMVVGPSGSGKSSVVMAGLLPALEKNIPEVKDWFFLAPVRPGEFPMDALARTLKLPFLNKPDDSPLKRWSRFGLRKILDDPDSRGLNELLREITHNPDERIVLIVDQFEEIFAPAANPDQQKQRRQFIDSLIAIATEPDTPILLLFTLRADFFHRILDTETLYNQVEPHLINIPPMTREELRSVIEKPAQDVNVTFDPNLAEDLLYEVLKRPESLPLLQFTLEQLFKHREERRLTRQSYDEIGGLQGAIDKHAQATYDKLPTPEHQREARKLFTEYFIYLAESHGEASHLESGEGITRRRVTQAELQLNDSNIRSETINAFIDSRLLTATSTVRQSTDLENITDITYEISHEALINAWEKFREWIKEDRKDIYLIQSLRPRATQWEQEKKKDLLLDKLALQQLREYRKRKELAPPMERIFEASQNQRTRQKSLVYASISLVLAVIVSLALVLVNYNKVFPSPPEPTIVTSKADSGPGTLADVLQKASDEARITFDTGLTGQTICLTSNILGKNVFEINKSITIQGPVASNINISSCTTSNYIAIGQGANVTIEHMAFINSYTHKHSIIENAGNLTMNKSKMSGNKSYNDAGAIYNTGNLILEDDIFDGNKVSTDGGAIKNLYGTVSINKSIISGNEAQGNGGGIYSQGGVVTVSGSRVLNNRADNNTGGGIEIVNGSFSMNDTRIESNHSDYTSGGVSGGLGGGIAIVGSVALITTSVITTNAASAKGGGIVVAKNVGNSSSSLVKLQDIIRTDNQSAIHYIRQNTGGDIAGELTPTGTTLQILDDPSIDNLGDPPDSYSPQKLPNYLGIANINVFCLDKGYSYGQISKHADPKAKDVMFTCFNQSNPEVSPDFSGQAICQSQYSASSGVDTIIDRMADYYDPTSLQCYKNLKLLGPIGETGFKSYCINQPQSQYAGLFDNSQYRDTAYDWLCQPKDTSKLPTGLSVTGACNMQYNVKDTIYRLANFNSVDGWECWEPA